MGRFSTRAVIDAPQPLPNLAPLLWDAAGLVTSAGSPAAHLFESARALGIPAVCGVELDGNGEIVAIDGHQGVVATLSLNGGDDG
jgi:phosphoenolpyruvate-protein kinase (PTS system EI component)